LGIDEFIEKIKKEIDTRANESFAKQ